VEKEEKKIKPINPNAFEGMKKLWNWRQRNPNADMREYGKNLMVAMIALIPFISITIIPIMLIGDLESEITEFDKLEKYIPIS
jgi:hypothetical protein